MKILCIFGKYNYGDPSRGIGYEYANFISAFKNLGHEVLFFESLNKSKYSSFIELNKKLLETVEASKPDIIFCVLMGYEIWLETLNILRESSNAALIHWATDDSWKYEQFSRFMSPAFDVYATTYPSALDKAQKDGYENYVLSQWAANSLNFVSPIKSCDCIYDVSFVGSIYGNRGKWLGDLRDGGINVISFGYGTENGPIAAEKIPEVINKSKVSLNFADSGLILQKGKLSRNRQIKARVFEIPGAGGLLMTEPSEHLEKFYSLEDEIVAFHSNEELLRKIKYLLKNPDHRDAIANAGFKKTVEEHTYEKRFEKLIEKAIEVRKHRKTASIKISFSDFENLAKKHELNKGMKLIKNLLLLPHVLIWGKKRGPRAARRLLFELNWRLMGKKTYLASGWPGRLFYNES